MNPSNCAYFADLRFRADGSVRFRDNTLRKRSASLAHGKSDMTINCSTDVRYGLCQQWHSIWTYCEDALDLLPAAIRHRGK
jgi:hypothetical protein